MENDELFETFMDLDNHYPADSGHEETQDNLPSPSTGDFDQILQGMGLGLPYSTYDGQQANNEPRHHTEDV
jgi:hypothetical protein